jgi:hypothetical protein
MRYSLVVTASQVTVGGNGHNLPPIINLSEAGGYYFAAGSAVLTPDFAMPWAQW